jgi:hypothetical protein
MATEIQTPTAQLADEFAYMLTNSMEDLYLVDHKLVEFAEQNEFKIADANKEAFIEIVLAKVKESAGSWFDAAKTDEEEMSQD